MTYIMPFATQERLRNTLHLIQQDSTIANTTRLTMQKLNLYFMNSPISKLIDVTNNINYYCPHPVFLSF